MLTSQQRAAVACDAHAVEIRAGAGCGKTFTLVERVARVAADGAPQSRLRVVTFTREATRILHRRIAARLGRDHGVQVGSFHQWAAHELPPQERRFLDEKDARQILKRAVARHGVAGTLAGLGGDLDAVGRAQALISQAKNMDTDMFDVVRYHAGLLSVAAALQDVKDTYDEAKGDRLDYEDLLLRFRDHVRKAGAAQKPAHLFVDEYQDVNRVQDDIVHTVAKRGGDTQVTVVGDPRQAIYGFRGSQPRYLDDFLRPYGRDGKRLPLATNFRSDKALVAATNELLPDAHPLRPRRGAPAGGAPVLLPGATQAEEASAAHDHVDRLLARGEDPAEVVVLARSRRLAAEFQKEAATRARDLAFVQRQRGVLAAVVTPDGMTPKPKRLDSRVTRVAERIVRAWRLPERPQDRTFMPDVAEIAHAPVVLTIHAAKGLEWDHVVLLGAHERGLPSRQAMNADTAVQKDVMAEEQRLLYVAATRARHSLVIAWTQGARGQPSRFLTPLTVAPTPKPPKAKPRGRAAADVAAAPRPQARAA